MPESVLNQLQVGNFFNLQNKTYFKPFLLDKEIVLQGG